MKRGIWMRILTPGLCVILIFTVLFSGCAQPPPPPEETCFEEKIAQVQDLITMTEQMPLSEEAKSSLVSGWNGVIAQYEQGLEADEQIQAVLDNANSYYTAEVCASCPLVCEEQCKDWKGDHIGYAICWWACLAGKAIGKLSYFEDRIAKVENLITATEAMPLSEEAKSTIISGWNGVIAQYEQGLEADEQIQAVLDNANSYYTAEVCASCPLVCEEQCKDWKGDHIGYAICWWACLAGKAIGKLSYFEDRIAKVENLITATEAMPLSEEAKSSLVSGWNGVIAQYEQGLEADEQIQAVLEDAKSYYTTEVCASCPLVCEEQCKDWKGDHIGYAICWWACLAGKAIGQLSYFEDRIAKVEGLITMTEEMPLSEEAKSTIVSGWNEVIAQYEQGLEADEQIQAVLGDAIHFYTTEVSASVALECEEQCKEWKGDHIGYAICWWACVLGKVL